MSNFEHGLGLIRGEADPRDYVYGISTAALPAEYLPQVKAKVHNQGQINNCATHALTASLENVLGGTYAFSWNYGNRRYSEPVSYTHLYSEKTQRIFQTLQFFKRKIQAAGQHYQKRIGFQRYL